MVSELNKCIDMNVPLCIPFEKKARSLFTAQFRVTTPARRCKKKKEKYFRKPAE